MVWLKKSLLDLKQENPKRNGIIVTHYASVFDHVCHPKNENNAVSRCFSSNALDDVLRAELMPTHSRTHWIHGHTHWNSRSKRGKALLVSNQLCNDDKNLTWWQSKTLYRPFDPMATISAV